MNGDFKRYIYIIGTICVVFLMGSIFIRILPWLLLLGVIGYIIIKIMTFIKGKSEEKNSSKFENSKDYEYDNNIQSDNYTDGEVIDVEYEDVDNKKGLMGVYPADDMDEFEDMDEFCDGEYKFSWVCPVKLNFSIEQPLTI